ncbi:MAG: DUF192 domain-containing protein [Elusimicrobiota bacterium]
MIVYNETRKIVLCPDTVEAGDFFSRFLGLMFKTSLPSGKGLLLYPGAMIHTCFMRFSIDVVFISRDKKVIGVYRSMKPWRFSRWHRGAYYTLEAACGQLSDKVFEGDILSFR